MIIDEKGQSHTLAYMENIGNLFPRCHIIMSNEDKD